MRCLFNLISSRNPKIVEKVAIFLANVSSSFDFEYLSDMSIDAIVTIVTAPSTMGPQTSEVTLLAVLIALLNFTTQHIAQGLENLGIPEALEEIVNNTELSLTVKGVCLLILTNFATQGSHKVTAETEAFAVGILKSYNDYADETLEALRNAVYAALVMLYNQSLQVLQPEVIALVSDVVLPAFGDDPLIVRVILEFTALLAKTKQVTLPLPLLDHAFRKLTSPIVLQTQHRDPFDPRLLVQAPLDKGEQPMIPVTEPVLIMLAARALWAVASSLEPETTSETFQTRLKALGDLTSVLEDLKTLGEQQHENMANEILSPFLGFIESICTFDLTKEFIDSQKSNCCSMVLTLF